MTNNSELIDQAQSIACCLSYSDPNLQVQAAKHTLRELSHRLGSMVVTIKEDAKTRRPRMTSLYGRTRLLTRLESTLWKLFRVPPRGTVVLNDHADWDRPK